MTTNCINTANPIGNAQGGTGTTIPLQNTYTLAYSTQTGFPFTTTGGVSTYVEYTLGTDLTTVISQGVGYLSVNAGRLSLLSTLSVNDNLTFYLGTDVTTDGSNLTVVHFPLLGLTAMPLVSPPMMASLATLNSGSPTKLRIYVTSTTLTLGTINLLSYQAPLTVNVTLKDS